MDDTITVELKRKDIIRLLRGVSCPSYTLINKLTKLGLGNFVGGFCERWDWIDSYTMNDLNIPTIELYDLYIQLTINED